MLIEKNAIANNAVVRDKKLAEPAEPNIVPEAPPPNEAPASAPFPYWIKMKPINTIEISR